MTINLDAAKAARREAKKEAPTVTFGGQDFVLPIELPFAAVEAIASIQEAQAANDGAGTSKGILAVVRVLLGDDYSAFMSHRPSMEDVEALFDGVMEEYGTSLGEQPPSEN
jgi:hypothetical protein